MSEIFIPDFTLRDGITLKEIQDHIEQLIDGFGEECPIMLDWDNKQIGLILND